MFSRNAPSKGSERNPPFGTHEQRCHFGSRRILHGHSISLSRRSGIWYRSDILSSSPQGHHGWDGREDHFHVVHRERSGEQKACCPRWELLEYDEDGGEAWHRIPSRRKRRHELDAPDRHHRWFFGPGRRGVVRRGTEIFGCPNCGRSVLGCIEAIFAAIEESIKTDFAGLFSTIFQDLQY